MTETTPEVNWTYYAQLDRVIDGDTVVLVVDNGFHNREHHSFRLRDVNTPEIFTSDTEEKALGVIAKSQTSDWFVDTDVCSGGQEFPLVIITQKDKQTFNRYIADIYCRGCGYWLNESLRGQGY